MTNLDNIKNETIIICEQNTKNKILKQLTKEKKLLNIKLLTKKELINRISPFISSPSTSTELIVRPL